MLLPDTLEVQREDVGNIETAFDAGETWIVALDWRYKGNWEAITVESAAGRSCLIGNEHRREAELVARMRDPAFRRRVTAVDRNDPRFVRVLALMHEYDWQEAVDVALALAVEPAMILEIAEVWDAIRDHQPHDAQEIVVDGYHNEVTDAHGWATTLLMAHWHWALGSGRREDWVRLRAWRVLSAWATVAHWYPRESAERLNHLVRR